MRSRLDVLHVKTKVQRKEAKREMRVTLHVNSKSLPGFMGISRGLYKQAIADGKMYSVSDSKGFGLSQ